MAAHSSLSLTEAEMYLATSSVSPSTLRSCLAVRPLRDIVALMSGILISV
jgi:hypothetical protein